jgi:hypothetical protein
MNSKNKNIRDLYRGINYFKNGYQPRSNLVKNENGDLLADSHNNSNMWKNYFPQLLNVPRVSGVRQIEIDAALQLALSRLKLLLRIRKIYKSSGTDEIPAS